MDLREAAMFLHFAKTTGPVGGADEVPVCLDLTSEDSIPEAVDVDGAFVCVRCAALIGRSRDDRSQRVIAYSIDYERATGKKVGVTSVQVVQEWIMEHRPVSRGRVELFLEDLRAEIARWAEEGSDR